MGLDAFNRATVVVSIGAVVENMSSLTQTRPPSLTIDAMRSTNCAALRVLITLRSEGRALAGHWELPGGKVEDNETPEQAVVRELREEVGIEVLPVMALPTVEHVYKHAHVRLLPFVCRRVSGLPCAVDVDEARWVGLDEFSGLRFPEASLPVLASLRSVIGCSD